MGLDELVNSKSDSGSSTNTKSKKQSKNKSKNKKQEGKNKPVGGQKTLRRSEVSDKRPSKVHVKEDRSVVDCLDCGKCSKGTKAPVVGVAKDTEGRVGFGSLMICDNIFCEDSIFDFEDPPLEFNRMDVHEQIVGATGGPGVGGW